MQDARFATHGLRLQHADEPNVEVARLVASASVAVWCARLATADILHAAVLDYESVLCDEQLQGARL